MMRKKWLRISSLVVIIVIAGFIINDTFTQSGVKELKGGFTEVVKYRNENNTGPIQQIYVVKVKDSTAAQLKEYGNLMPHHKYGITKVYFFMEGSDTPKSLAPGKVNFDPKYNTSCFALYEKGAMGDVELKKNPSF